MFAPIAATKAKSKAAVSSTSSYVRQRLTPLAHWAGQGSVEQVSSLQRQLGNQAALRLREHQGGLQPKLAVGPVDHPQEREADRVAGQVMRMPDPTSSLTVAPSQINRKCADCEKDDQGQNLRTKPAATHQTPVTAPSLVNEVLRSPGQPLNSDTRAFMEPRFGRDLGAIRIHVDSAAMESASSVNALAFTIGQHIAFGRDQYAPGTEAGKRLLAHELTHAIQQQGLPQSGLHAPAPIEAKEGVPQPMRIASGSGLSIQRACDQPESFYRASPRFCRDDTFSPSTHPGRTCYREVIQSYFGCPPGDHCCFASDGSVEDSRDVTSLASSKDEDDGSCGWRWSCVARHTLTDYLPAVAGRAMSPLTCAAQCARSGAPEQCTASCVQQAQPQ